ncbi:MAG: histidinol-phosphatase HisJ family protein [Syntrophomonas sp.]
MVQVDNHVHALAHGEYRYSHEWISRFIQKARKRGIKEIGLCEHDEFRSLVDFDLIDRMRSGYADIKIRIGLEVDYIPGREEEIKQIAAECDYDYLIGSVHYIDGWGFDHPDYKHGFDNRDIDETYQSYFNLVKAAAMSGLFDVIGHLDLIKIWGHRPEKHEISYYLDPVLKSIKASGTIIEINSSGNRKPVGEMYPDPRILEMMAARDIPITFGSDAHHPDQIGEGLNEAGLIAYKLGYRQVVGFEQRRKILTPLEL